MQLHNSISIRDAWWNVCCRQCGTPVAENTYRDVKITWSEVLSIAIDLWGNPHSFFVRDFLISFSFANDLTLVFCTQGPRRGEIDILVPAPDNDGVLKVIMSRIRAVTEGDDGGTNE